MSNKNTLFNYIGGSGPSSWDWSKVTYQTSDYGRKFARYSAISGNPDVGTVMSMTDRTGPDGPTVDRNILVLDAKYRTNAYVYYSDSSVDLNSSGNLLHVCNISYDYVIRDTDIVLNSTDYSNKDIQTSRYNTTKLVTFDATKAEASSYCRSINVNGVGCDLPNINVLSRIWCELYTLHSLDPTASSYPQYSGGELTRDMFISSSWNGFSTEYSNEGCYIFIFGPNEAVSSIYTDYHDDRTITCPILEL